MNAIGTEYQRICKSYLLLTNSNNSVLEAHQLHSEMHILIQKTVLEARQLLTVSSSSTINTSHQQHNHNLKLSSLIID